MSKALCDLSGGELETSPLASILIEALRIRASGELLIEAKGGISRIYFRNGQPCGAQIFFGFKPLGQFLLELGWIDIRALERSLMAVADGRKQGEALVALGFLTEEQLARGLALHHLGHVRSLASLTSGTYRFTSTEKLPPWTVEVRISGHRSIVDSLSVPPGEPISRRILRAVQEGARLRLRQGWERYAGYFQLDEAEGLFLSKLVEPKSLPEILGQTGLEPHRANALSAALVLMGVLAPVTTHGAQLPPLVHTPVPQITPGPATPGPRIPGPEPTPIPSYATPGQRIPRPEPTPIPSHATPGPRIPRPEPTPIPQAREWARTPGPRLTPGPPGEEKDRRVRMMHRAFESIGASPFRKDGQAPSAILRAPPEDEAGFGAWIEATWKILPDLGPFEKLGLSEEAGAEEIKRAYIRAAKRLHPDRIPPSLDPMREKIRRIFVGISEAYELLRSDERRETLLRPAAAVREDDPALYGEVEAILEDLRARGLSALSQRRWEEARQTFLRAVQIRGDADLRAHAIWASYNDPRNQDPDRTRAELEKLHQACPDSDVVCYYSGALARLDGDSDLAERRFRAAIERNPNHREARQELRLLEVRRLTRGPLQPG